MRGKTPVSQKPSGEQPIETSQLDVPQVKIHSHSIVSMPASTLGKPVGALVSGLAVLRYLASSSTPAGVTRIAHEVGLNSSTCFNILKTLVHERLITFDDNTKTYAIGLAVVELAKGALEQASYARMLRPYLQDLASRHNVTMTLWQYAAEDRLVLVDRADNASSVRTHLTIGQRLPMFVGAVGRSFAANSTLDADALRKRFKGLRWQRPLSFEQYLRQVEDARRMGYAVDSGYLVRGVTSVAASVIDTFGRPSIAISAVAFTAQFEKNSLKSLGEDLRDVAQQMTRAINGPACLPANLTVS